MTKDEQIKKLMKNLSISENEAKEVMQADKAIDKGEKLFELSDEQKKNAKAVTICCEGMKKTKSSSTRKSDPIKSELIQILTEALQNHDCGYIDVTNPEREFLFTFNERKFKIVLSSPRS